MLPSNAKRRLKFWAGSYSASLGKYEKRMVNVFLEVQYFLTSLQETVPHLFIKL